jgi:uncharacterized LabA/DUF88 family protein
MNKEMKNYAYIDGANLHKGIESLGWDFDYRRFRIWLKDKYSVTQAYLFIGLIPKYKKIYTELQEAGYTLIFKEVVYDGKGRAKGNCDADLVLKVVRDVYENDFSKAIIVSSDGDYAGLVSFLMEKNKLRTVLSPSATKRCSILLKRTNASIAYIDNQRNILEAKKEKAPIKDEP